MGMKKVMDLCLNKGRRIARIDYDMMNNPVRIQFTNGNVTKYVYSATGEKLRVIYQTAVPNISVAIGSTRELMQSEILFTDSTDYLLGGALTMRNGRIDKYQFEEGYCQATQYNATQDNFTFLYYDKDHLGNVRQVTKASNSTGTVVQTMNYYPLGAQFCDGSATSDVQPYKYNGKELDKMHGLNTYDYGARQYNPITARWDRMDPLAEKDPAISPFVYCRDNPMNAIDPDGKQPVKYIDSNGKKHISWTVVILVQAQKEGASHKKISRHEEYKHNLIEQYAKQFNQYLNGDGAGVTNTSDERIVSDFKITVVEVSDPYDRKEARSLSKEYGQEIKEEGGKNGDAAVFMEGGTNGALGLTKGASLITIAPNAVEGTESHELFHTSGIGDNGYTHGGILNSPPEPIIPEEVDKLWDILPERK